MKADIGQIADDVRIQTDMVKNALKVDPSDICIRFNIRQDLNRHELYLDIVQIDPETGEPIQLLQTCMYSTRTYNPASVATIAAVATNTVKEEIPTAKLLEYSLHTYGLPR